ncbi:MAG: hypothetical protein CL755_11025 [Chloroflexi bacterium]|nr:hypothetical protein [Chloroflexota bacterium]HIB11877.1 type II secretion system protein [Dehalococcoidia bacterium]HIM49542.1 type II secretion system protein [Dehalococcoidia bacterium]
MIPNPAKAINARSGFPHRRISPRYRNLLNHPTRRKRGFTLVELLAVFAIIGVLAGSVNGLESTGQSAQIQSDAKILETAADRFFNESFPQTYPVSNPDTNGHGVLDHRDSRLAVTD